MMNSLWGRIGLNMHKTRIAITDTMAELNAIVDNPENMDVYADCLGGDKIMVVYKTRKENLEPNMKGSDVVAAFTTAHARLVLLEQLTRIGPNVCYYDTDSIIYSKIPGGPEIPIGTSLGEWTDEIVKYGPGIEVHVFIFHKSIVFIISIAIILFMLNRL